MTIPAKLGILDTDQISPLDAFIVHQFTTGKDRRFLYGSLVTLMGQYGKPSSGSGIQRGDGLGGFTDTGKTFPIAATDVTGLATVATSGSYSDLSGTPSLLSAFTDDVGFVHTSSVGAANGVASLDSGGLIPTSQLPPLAINTTSVVSSQSEMLALTAERGDVAVRTDTGKTFILSSDSPSTLADWKEIVSTGSITSVNGQTGNVSLTTSNIAEGTNLYFTSARVADKQPLNANLTAIANSTAFSGMTYRTFVMENGAFTAKAISPNRVMVTDSHGSPTAMDTINGRVVQTNVSTGAPEVSTITTSELGHLSGVTSNIQTQLNARQPVAGVLTTLSSLTLTGSRVLQSVNGTLNALALTGSAWVVTQSDGTLATAAPSVSTTEFGYLDGVTSSIQTQLDARIAKSIGTAKGDLIGFSASGTPARVAVGSNGHVVTADSTQTCGWKWAAPSGGGGGGAGFAFSWTFEAYNGSPGSGKAQIGSGKLLLSTTDANGKTASVATMNLLGRRYTKFIFADTTTFEHKGAVFLTGDLTSPHSTIHSWDCSIIGTTPTAGSVFYLAYSESGKTVQATTYETSVSINTEGTITTVGLAPTFGKLVSYAGNAGGAGTPGVAGEPGTAGSEGTAGANWTDGTYFYTGGAGGAAGTANGGAGGDGGVPGASATPSFSTAAGNIIQLLLSGGGGGAGGAGGTGGTGGTGLSGTNGGDATMFGNGTPGEPGASANGGTGGTGGTGGSAGSLAVDLSGANNCVVGQVISAGGSPGGVGETGGTGGVGVPGGPGATGATGASGCPASITVSGGCNQIAAYMASGTEYGANLTVTGGGNQVALWATPGTFSISGYGNTYSGYLGSGASGGISGYNNQAAGQVDISGDGCVVAAPPSGSAYVGHDGVLATGDGATKSLAKNGHINWRSHRYVNELTGQGDIFGILLQEGVYAFSLTGVEHDAGYTTTNRVGRIAGRIVVASGVCSVTTSITEDYAGAGALGITAAGQVPGSYNFRVYTANIAKTYIAELHIMGMNVNG